MAEAPGLLSSQIKPAGRQCETFHDEVFSGVRRDGGVPDDFINTGWSFDRFEAGGGKGGTLMAYIADTLIIKELSDGDHLTLLKIARSYGEHMRGGDSVICPVYLHFRDVESDRKFFAMKNCVGSGPFLALYDLKGCADDKTLEKEGHKIKAVHKRCWNVGMWCKSNWTPDRHTYYNGKRAAANASIDVLDEQRSCLLQTMRRDTDWLVTHKLMDYSLLVAVKAVSSSDDGSSMPSAGPLPMVRRNTDGCHIAVHVSIIDYLQKWTVGKKVAKVIKFAECNKATVPPKVYARRFCRKFGQRFNSVACVVETIHMAPSLLDSNGTTTAEDKKPNRGNLESILNRMENPDDVAQKLAEAANEPVEADRPKEEEISVAANSPVSTEAHLRELRSLVLRPLSVSVGASRRQADDCFDGSTGGAGLGVQEIVVTVGG